MHRLTFVHSFVVQWHNGLFCDVWFYISKAQYEFSMDKNVQGGMMPCGKSGKIHGLGYNRGQSDPIVLLHLRLVTSARVQHGSGTNPTTPGRDRCQVRRCSPKNLHRRRPIALSLSQPSFFQAWTLHPTPNPKPRQKIQRPHKVSLSSFHPLWTLNRNRTPKINK